ncbi:hypothetical protein GCM10011505_45970 [Tistrella bauzanensis]|uniref:Preprotein translocase subunit SecB n=1 Tax=Tistrella bauzanensis TaxID=657419 RepID=A0ABQ1J4R3_9PROT|nr:hypothetical protein [Tistrella bauzanensis]GGB60045.1 hypothetical protein GCM10011505_45970 [Tistrella bauzanensis]
MMNSSPPHPGAAAMEAYEAVRRAAELDDVVLRNARIDVHPKARALVKMQGDTLRFVIDRAQPEAERNRDAAMVVGHFTMTATVDAPQSLIDMPDITDVAPGDDMRRIVLITGQYDVSFTNIPDDADDDAVGLFIGLVGKFAVYPYFRNLVSQAAGMTHLDLPILPVLRDPQDRPHQAAAPAADTTAAPTKARKRRKPAEAANKAR